MRLRVSSSRMGYDIVDNVGTYFGTVGDTSACGIMFGALKALNAEIEMRSNLKTPDLDKAIRNAMKITAIQEHAMEGILTFDDFEQFFAEVIRELAYSSLK